MKLKIMALVGAVVLSTGAAQAAEAAMDCCAKCECCKDKKPDAAPAGQDHSAHQH